MTEGSSQGEADLTATPGRDLSSGARATRYDQLCFLWHLLVNISSCGTSCVRGNPRW